MDTKGIEDQLTKVAGTLLVVVAVVGAVVGGLIVWWVV